MLIGVVTALLLVPTAVAGAATLYNGIVGTSGHKADVSPTSQLLTAEAAPSSFFHRVANARTSPTVIATPPAGRGLIVSGLSVDVLANGSVETDELYVGPPSCSTALLVIAFVSSPVVWNGTSLESGGGLQSVPVSPGIAIPAADRLCGLSSSGSNQVSVAGYSVASSTVTTPHTSQAKPKLSGH